MHPAPAPKANLAPIEITTPPGATPTHSVIWLHGLGASGHDFAPIVPALRLPPQPPLRFVFPHAPMRRITINGGVKMRGWYDIVSMDFTHAQDQTGIAQSAEIVRDLIQAEIARDIPAHHIFLGGFSQGGAMALHIGLHHPQKLAGILSCSAYLPLAETFAADIKAETPTLQPNRTTPIFIAHGTHDPLIPLHLARQGEALLTQHQHCYPLTYREYPIEHSVCDPEIADISDFLKTHL